MGEEGGVENMEFPGVLKTASGISRAIYKCKNDVEIPGVIKKKSWNFQGS